MPAGTQGSKEQQTTEGDDGMEEVAAEEEVWDAEGADEVSPVLRSPTTATAKTSRKRRGSLTRRR